jgi:polyisoprenoid-binding protein YceI
MKNIALLLLCLITLSANADKYLTKTGKISFYSKATMEDIEAHNRAVGVLVNTETADLKFKVLIKSFVFEKSLMQEHFNENYLESNKYPKASFSGKLKNMSSVNFSKNGKYKVTVTGTLEIHGVKKKVSESGYIIIKNGTLGLESSFNITLADYKIKIPGAVRDKIAKTVKIVIDADLKKI